MEFPDWAPEFLCDIYQSNYKNFTGQVKQPRQWLMTA